MFVSQHLDAYLERIGYAGPRFPDLAALTGIVAGHTRAIPFENLDPLLGRTIRLDPDSLVDKLVHGGRGGYCFEQNLLLSHALAALGFQVVGLVARVKWNAPAELVTPRTHMVVRIELDDGPYVADVGFGGTTLTGPIRLEPDTIQATPNERVRLRSTPSGWELQVEVAPGAGGAVGEMRAMYTFDLQEQHRGPPGGGDYDLPNWYTSTHPSSHFLRTLIAARAEAGTRLNLRDTELTRHSVDGAPVRRVLRSADELKDVLAGEFQLRLPDDPVLERVLASVLTRAPQAD